MNLKSIEELQKLIRPNIELFYELKDSQSIHDLQALSITLGAQMYSVTATWSYWNDECLTLESNLKNDTALKFMQHKVPTDTKSVSDKIAEMKTRVELSDDWTRLAIAKASAGALKALHDDISECVYSIRQRVSILGKEKDLLNGGNYGT